VQTTAEGVQTGAQRDILRRIGCDELQGLLFSEPVSAAEINTLLMTSRIRVVRSR